MMAILLVHDSSSSDAAHGWRAELALRFASREGRTYLAKRTHTGPLLVQRAFHPEGGPCHVYIVHPPGGIVGGDQLSMQVAVESAGHALLTTPAATKFYRSAGATSRQVSEFRADGATLEWLPQETILYCGAQAHCSTRIVLHQSKFIGWEIPCLGLPARNEPFTSGTLKFDLELWADDRPLFIDRLRIDGATPARVARWGLAGHEAIGSLLAYPADANALAAARSAIEGENTVVATLVDEVLICRAVASHAQQIKNTFVRIWQTLRPLLLDRPAVLPRIWAT